MDHAALRSAFPVLERLTYLNAGTAGPLPAAASRAAVEAWEWVSTEGRSGNFYERTTPLRDELRARYARLLAAEPGDVALTTGTSDGVARVLAGFGLRAGDEVVTADDEHPGLQAPLAVARARGVRITVVPLADVADAVGSATTLVACSHVSWSTGAYAPAALREVARSVPVLLDGAQGFGAVPLDVAELGVSFYAGSGQKWACGPVGLGALWVAPEHRDRVAVDGPAPYGVVDFHAGLDAELAPDARRFDAGSIDLAPLACAVAAFDVLEEAGFGAIQERAAALAGQLAAELAARGHEVLPRDATPLVSWAMPDDEAAIAMRDRVREAGVVIRDLPGFARLRASVGAWNDASDLEALLAALDG